MQIHNAYSDAMTSEPHRHAVSHAMAEMRAASYLSRKPGLITEDQRAFPSPACLADTRQQPEDMPPSAQSDDSSCGDRAGMVRFSKTHAADAELDGDGRIHLVPVRVQRESGAAGDDRALIADVRSSLASL